MLCHSRNIKQLRRPSDRDQNSFTSQFLAIDGDVIGAGYRCEPPSARPRHFFRSDR